MFSTPIKHVRLKSLEELKAFSFRKFGEEAEPKTFCSNNGQTAYTDESGYVYVTPSRTGVLDILLDAGYREGSIFVPFSNGEERPYHYKWLARIADEENWCETFSLAKYVADNKGVKPVDTNGISFRQIRDITEHGFFDKENDCIYSRMAIKFLLNGTAENVGTYIVISSNTVMVCDEYGRTYLLTIKGTINELVNRMIEAGYTRCIRPDLFVRESSKPKTEQDA